MWDLRSVGLRVVASDPWLVGLTKAGPSPLKTTPRSALRFEVRFWLSRCCKRSKKIFDFTVFGVGVAALPLGMAYAILIDFPNRLFFSTSPHRGREEILLFTVFGNKI